MPPASSIATPSAEGLRPRRAQRVLLWAALVLLLLVAQSLLVVLTLRHEASRLQDAAEGVASDTAAELRRQMLQVLQALQKIEASVPGPGEPGAQAALAELFKAEPALAHLEWRDASRRITQRLDAPQGLPLFGHLSRESLEGDADAACQQARRNAAPSFSRSYFVPQATGQGFEVIDLCMAQGGRGAGLPSAYLVASFVLSRWLEQAATPRHAREYELSFVEADGTRLARAGVRRGQGVYLGERAVDLPGAALQLRVNAVAGRPSLIPNLAVALVLGLSVALFALVIALARDVRRRAQAERALAEALAVRQAMEDSLITGLRARDLGGAITYVNPAFCAMVGYSAEELQQIRPPAPPPYWPPERVDEYTQRQLLRLEPGTAARAEAREGFESIFVRRNGERFPVMIYEAPLVDGNGRHTGWMGAVVDLSAQRRIEEHSRQQQERLQDRLQASARLATVGEMASLLSHELNQPLAAIASYASGSLNLLAAPDEHTGAEVAMALQRMAEQAERAGRVIKSVHDFVRRREQAHESLRVDELIEAVLPLVRLQARKTATRVAVELPTPPLPRVLCDRTLLEQVLLNLTRNGMQAMEACPPEHERVLTLRVRREASGPGEAESAAPPRVAFSVIDRGSGIAPDVAARLFTPFFTTRAEGMGLGLSLCRTVVEQHGGTLSFGPGPEGVGTEFRFTLAAAARAAAAPAAPATTAP